MIPINIKIIPIIPLVYIGSFKIKPDIKYIITYPNAKVGYAIFRLILEIALIQNKALMPYKINPKNTYLVNKTFTIFNELNFSVYKLTPCFNENCPITLQIIAEERNIYFI